MSKPVTRKSTTATVTKTAVATKNKPTPTLASGQTFVHNKSRGTFHVPLLNENPDAREKAIAFELDEVKKLEARFLNEQRFIDCVERGFLEVFTEEQYADFLKQRSRDDAKASRNKQTMGVHPESGLPLNKTLALQYINSITDVGLLEKALEAEENNTVAGRRSVLAAIEDRIEELNSSDEIHIGADDDDGDDF